MTTSMMNLRRLINSGDLVLWHDYRSGHCANLAGLGTTADGTINQSQGYFRSGRGFITGAAQDFEGVADPTSVGYIKVAYNSLLVPPVGGCCVIASYIADEYPGRSNLIGFGAYGTPAAACWELLRDSRDIRFATSDGANEDDFQYIIDPVLSTIETVSVRYTGGTGPNNCTIKVHAPAISSSTGTIDKVPADVDTTLQVCSQSGGELQPFWGVMRYVAFIRGAQTQAVIDEVVAELEAFRWQTRNILFDRDGSYDRRLQYASKFGGDVSTVQQVTAGAEVSNSGWHLMPSGSSDLGIVDTMHINGNTVWAVEDIVKVLLSQAKGGDPSYYSLYRFPITRVACTPAEAAYGTWDFWLYTTSGATANAVWIVSLYEDMDTGYELRVDSTGMLSLYEWAGGVDTSLADTAAGAIALDAWTHFRVTRDDDDGEFNVYYNDGSGWVLAFTVIDATVTTSNYMMFGYNDTTTKNCALSLGNNRGDYAFFKWEGVVKPIPDPT